MLRTEKISGRYFAIACCSILLLFFLSIVGRFLVRQIVVKKMGISNDITAAIFWDAPGLNKLLGQDPKERGGQNIAIDWQKRYPFAEGETVKGGTVKTAFSDRYTTKVLFLEKKITDYTGKILIGRKNLSKWNQSYRKILAWNIIALNAEKDRKDVFYLQNGYLTFYNGRLKERDIQEIADSVADFQSWLEKRNISFLYVNNGSKVDPWNKQMNPMQSINEATNENGDALQAALARRDIAYLDMRQEMHQAGLDWYASYYKTDHHWKVQTGMWAAGVLANKLNRDYGFHYDFNYFQPENYVADTYSWKGEQWKVLYERHAQNYESEPYTYFLPKFPTQLTVEIPSRGLKLQGEYKDTLFDRETMEENRQYTDEESNKGKIAYYNTTWTNDPLGIFKNQLSVSNAKKILILQDSFSWYLTTYLALDTAEIHVIHPGGFTGSIRKYIEEVRPDMVIVMFAEYSIQKIDWKTHKSMFDFR